ncbi:MAG TPA: aspartyl/asparaginyl beta-hydroxylase domain-containing protein [Bacteroidia bacterium]|nr:aspartyl/asparaginyl beta-hydroxylase domain-containing protein [Bacteroidia bacterium]
MIPAYEKNSPQSLTPWYCYKGGEPDPGLPAFFDDVNWQWIKDGEKKFSVIRTEIENLLKQKHGILEPYFHTSLIETGKWEVVDFYFWNKKHEAHCAACPELAQWLKEIPGMTTAGVSRLAPHTEIKPHPGDTNTIARCHFGLVIPAGLPECGIKVKGETRAWEEGKFTVFCDSFIHSAWNYSDKFRYVLIIDVVLPRFIEQQKEISKNVRSFLRLQELMEKRPWIRKLPGPILGMMRHFFKFTS